MSAAPPPSLADLHRLALARWATKGSHVHVRIDFDGARYMALAVRTTTKGSGAEECASSVDHPTAPDALRGLGDRLTGKGEPGAV